MLARFKEVKWKPRVHIGDCENAGLPKQSMDGFLDRVGSKEEPSGDSHRQAHQAQHDGHQN
jgi:hypothetical protein